MKAGKRALGSVFQRSQDGRWVVRVTLPDGKRVTRYAKDKADAERQLATLLTTPDLAPAAPYTVATWLDEYLKRANVGRAPSTILDRKHLGVKIKANLGTVRLDKLTPARVQAFVDTLEGAHRTRLKSVQLLRSALNEAVALGHLTRNPALPVKLPRQPMRKAGVSWTQDQARLFLEVNADAPKILLFRLGLQTGARIGELLALRVEDYDAKQRTLRIERTVSTAEGKGKKGEASYKIGPTKTEAGARSFPLSPDAVQTIQAMLARRAALKVEAGPAWQDGGWLFPNEVGGLVLYRLAHRTWAASLRRVQAHVAAEHARQGGEGEVPQFPMIRTHDLRVTFISLALRRGVKPEVVARMVGHSSPLITLRIYRQVFQDELDETRDMLAGMI